VKNITPAHMHCDSGWCPSIHESEDGRHYMVVGKNANLMTTREWREDRGAKPGHDELVIIIDRALLSTIRNQVREECAKIADRQASDSKARNTAADDFGVYAAINIAETIRALKETPHE